MAYIDATYYNETYKGKTADAATLAVFLDKASEIIDQITVYKIPLAGGLTTYSSFIQERVKMATAAQAEFLVTHGEQAGNTGGGLQSVNVGSFSYSTGGQAMSGASGGRTSPAVLEYLRPTGLLYMGVDTV